MAAASPQDKKAAKETCAPAHKVDCMGAAVTISADPARRAPELAADLVKFFNVAGVKSHAPNGKRATATGQQLVETSDQPKEPLYTQADLIHVVGNEISKPGAPVTGLDERPGWTATNRDMTKDLAYRKVCIARDVVPMENRMGAKSSLATRLASLPFHTLMVRWRLSYNFPVYTPRIVYGILSRFGKIATMGVLSANSAFVVFYHEYHACRAVTAPRVGFSYCPLICRWWYTERYKFPVTDPADVKREDLLLSDGRLERNSKRHIAQIKREFWRKAAALSYDVSTFRP